MTRKKRPPARLPRETRRKRTTAGLSLAQLKEFAFKLIRKKGRSPDSVARGLGLRQTMLRSWLRNDPPRLHRRDELGRLRLENAKCWRTVKADVNLEAVEVLRDQFVELADAVGGDAPKSVITLDGRPGHRYDHAYIAKAPRTSEGPSECATEFLITCIGKMLPMKIASGRLVRFPETSSYPAGIRYMSRFFLDRDGGEELVHASRLAATCFEMREEEFFSELPQQGKEWSFYSTSMVEEIFEAAHFEVAEALLNDFARMLVFDALVGAHDRHPQNWGIVQNARARTPPYFAPVYDTARGLFWNSSDEKLRAWDGGMRRSKIESYAEASKSLIGYEGLGEKPNHFLLIEQLSRFGKPVYRAAFKRMIRSFQPALLTILLQRKFGGVFSPLRLSFIDDLLRFRHERLISIVG